MSNGVTIRFGMSGNHADPHNRATVSAFEGCKQSEIRWRGSFGGGGGGGAKHRAPPRQGKIARWKWSMTMLGMKFIVSLSTLLALKFD